MFMRRWPGTVDDPKLSSSLYVKITRFYTTHDAPVIAAKIINIAQGNTMDFAE